MPTPLSPTPSPTVSNLSGGGWYEFSSGGTAGSSSTNTSGTYAEYTQFLTIEYTRNPKGTTTNGGSYPVYNMSSVSGETRQVNSTNLQLRLKTYNSCKFITGNFTLSTYTQPQKFAIDKSAYDKDGNYCGGVSGTDNQYLFGPQGVIYTTQPYIKRDLKTSADVEYSYATEGCSHAYLDTSSADGTSTYKTAAYLGYDFKDYIPVHWDVDNLGAPAALANQGDQFQIYGGSYTTSTEPGYGNNVLGLQRLITFIEDNVSDITNSFHYNRLRVPICENNTNFWDEVNAIEQNPYYNTSHHQYA